MAAVSEAMLIFNTRIVPSYVSSSGYYGYVPPINELTEHHHNNYQQHEVHNDYQQHQQGQQQNLIRLNNNETTHQCHDIHHNQHRYGYNNSSAMETDGDENHIEDTHCQNNHCVIPETARRLNGCGGGVGAFYRVANDNNNEVLMISRRTNRKRTSYDDPGLLLGNMKKLRKGMREFTSSYRHIVDSRSDSSWLRDSRF